VKSYGIACGDGFKFVRSSWVESPAAARLFWLSQHLAPPSHNTHYRYECVKGGTIRGDSPQSPMVIASGKMLLLSSLLRKVVLT